MKKPTLAVLCCLALVVALRMGRPPALLPPAHAYRLPLFFATTPYARILTGRAIDLNTANERTLELLPGIGPAMARRIVYFRAQHGPFHRPTDLLAVPGIGPRTMERLVPWVTVSKS